MRFFNRPHLALTLGLSLVLAACAAPEAGYTALTADQPLAQAPEGLTVSVSPAAVTPDFKVQLRAFTAADLAASRASELGNAAFAARPAALSLVSPLFTVASQGAVPAQLFLAVIAPAGQAAPGLDLYAWDGTTWAFLPSEAQGSQRAATVSALPRAVGLFQAAPSAPLALARLDPGDILPVGAPVDALLLGGVLAQANGSLTGVLPNLPPGLAAPLYPVITADAGQSAAMLADPAARAAQIQILAQLAAGGYAGLALDYRGLTAASRADFTALVTELRPLLRAQNRTLWVYIDLAEAAGGYDWGALGAAADGLLARLPSQPAALGDGTVDAQLQRLTSLAERGKVRLVTTASAVIGDAQPPRALGQAEALAALGAAQASAWPETLLVQQAVTVTLSGGYQTITDDAPAAAPRLEGGPAAIWLTTPYTLRQRLAMVERYRLGGAVVEDLFRAGVTDMTSAVAAFRAGAALEPTAVNLTWTTRDANNGIVAEGAGQPGQPYFFTPAAAGDYTVSARVQAGGVSVELGAVPVTVAAVPPPAATQAPTAGSGGNSGSGSSGNSGNSGSSGNNGGSGVFVPPPPISAGIFELGGQVPGYLANPTVMKQAGMTWVKFQVRGGGGDAIAAAKSNGFKVLLSVIGDKNRVTDPAYWAEYAAWVGGLAAQGADAIEVWNEPNIDHEWPAGQISGATYTQLLAKAYAAIKAANPGTLVVSAGPAPTGAEAAFPGLVMNDDTFLAQMAQAGAANYMDCVGLHFNSGTTSPNATTGSALSGYHYSFYFWPMVDLYYNSFGGSRPLCFTELGYLTGEGYGALPGNFAWAGNTTVAQQAQWLAESASLAGSSGKVRLMMIWNVDFTQYAGDPQAGYAILRPGGSCPACSALDAVMP